MEIRKMPITWEFSAEISEQIGKLASEEKYSPIWQTLWWNLMLQKTSYAQKWIFIWAFEGAELVNYAIIEKRSVWMGMFWNFIIGWPLNWKYLDKILSEVKISSKEENAIFTQIEPLNEISFPESEKWAYKKFIEQHTAIIDLTKTEEEILADMKQKWRYNIKVAEKSSVTVEEVELTEENIKIFYSLLEETKSRDEFAINSLGYFQDFASYLKKSSLGKLYFAKKDWEVLASGMFVHFWKYALYYYWASTSDNAKRKYMPAYLLQWTAIKNAKEAWMEVFDFLWIADPEDKKSHLAWVTDFKLKLTNETIKWPESRIIVRSCFKYALLKIKKAIKGFMR